jgi:transposase-like protein
VQVVLQEMLGAEMTEALEAEQGERTPTHLGYRAGYFPSTLVTRVSFEMKLETLKPRLEPALGLSALRGP